MWRCRDLSSVIPWCFLHCVHHGSQHHCQLCCNRLAEDGASATSMSPAHEAGPGHWQVPTRTQPACVSLTFLRCQLPRDPFTGRRGCLCTGDSDFQPLHSCDPNPAGCIRFCHGPSQTCACATARFLSCKAASSVSIQFWVTAFLVIGYKGSCRVALWCECPPGTSQAHVMA